MAFLLQNIPIMSNYPLSICIPSKRNLEQSKASISSAIGFCDSTGSELVISDSSGVSNKEEMWKKIPLPFMKYIKSDSKKNSNWRDNWYKGIENCSGKFIGVVSDDDIIVNLDDSIIDYKEIDHSDIAGIKPLISLWSSSAGIYKINKFNIDGNTALERVKQYQILAAGNNTTYYSFYKNNILKDIYSLLQHHPTKGGYIDWSITLTCVAAGKVLVDASKLLIYKNNNWFGSQEFINKQACKLYEDCGLGDLGYLMSPLLNALDVFILIMRKKSELALDEKLEAAEYMLDYNLQLFIRNCSHHNEFNTNELFKKINTKDNIENKLNKSLAVIESKFSNTLANKYKLFYENALEAKWGDF